MLFGVSCVYGRTGAVSAKARADVSIVITCVWTVTIFAQLHQYCFYLAWTVDGICLAQLHVRLGWTLESSSVVLLTAMSPSLIMPVLLGYMPLSLALNGKCGEIIWQQNFDNIDIAQRIAAQNGQAFPPIPILTG
jgi:hypothetical protein